MKILDIIKENDELIMEQPRPPRNRRGTRVNPDNGFTPYGTRKGFWNMLTPDWRKEQLTKEYLEKLSSQLKKATTAGNAEAIAQLTKQVTRAQNNDFIKQNPELTAKVSGISSTPMMAKPTKGDSALDYDDAGYEKYDNPADASTIADLEKADYDSEMAQWNADNKKRTKDNSQAIVNTEKSNRDQAQKRAQRQKQKELARMKANAGMKDDDYKTSPGSKRTAQDLALDKEYTYKADDGRRLKYKQGDIRNAFNSSPDSRKAGSDKVIRGDRVGNRLVDKKPVPRTNQDDRAK